MGHMERMAASQAAQLQFTVQLEENYHSDSARVKTAQSRMK